MPISPHVQSELFQRGSDANATHSELIRIPLTRLSTAASEDLSDSGSRRRSTKGAIWTPREHERFLEGLELFPSGPWRVVAAYVGSKTTRQTITHAQKYRQKIARRQRGLRIAVQDLADPRSSEMNSQHQQSSDQHQQQLRASALQLRGGGDLEFDLELDAGSVSDLELATFLLELDLAGEGD
ncbi:hypothetical protein Gpo141_00007120 [Globisporangium polare]